MKSSYYFMVWLLYFVAISCSNQPNNLQNSSHKKYKGRFIAGEEVSGFRDCKTGKEYWLKDPKGDLVEQYNNLTTLPYEPVFVEIEGYITPSTNQGYESDYDGVFNLTKIIKVSSYLNTKGYCHQAEMRAFGIIPYWSVLILNNDEAVFVSETHEICEMWAYQKPVKENNTITYRFKNGAGEERTLTFYKEQCPSPAENEFFPYKSTLIFGEERLEGCGIIPDN